MHAHDLLSGLRLPTRDGGELPESSGRFADGARWHIEIPSVEGPDALQAVVEEAEAREVPVHRVSQGSGIWMLTDDEISRMVAIGAEKSIEVCLFSGPRAGWDTGVQASTPGGRVISGSLRGADQLAFGLEDVVRGCELGIRSVLISDLGLLSVVAGLRAAGDLPTDLIIKASASLPVTNPATARVLEDLGATTLNLAVDLPVAAIAAIRAAVDAPLDLYIESSDDFGGVVRHYDIPEIVRVAAPVHLKFAVRNSAGIYPSGLHLADYVDRVSRERVRRAQLGLGILRRLAPEL